MKKKLTLFFFLLLGYHLSAQTTQWNLISSGGGYLENEAYNLHWVSGQTAIQAISNNSVQVSQGFLQSSHIIVSIDNLSKYEGSLTVAPNPASQYFSIESTIKEGLLIELIDVWGQNIFQTQLQNSIKQIDVNHLPQGTYFLRVFTLQNELIKTFKILKIKS